ncbi:MAG: FISUMP domain-containing protein [Candidatus Saccharibacteria bacterium]|nr:FISUMP domain-containing protein [Candidatus Saccharibacteria bacterium]
MQKGDSVVLGGLVGLTILSGGILTTVSTAADDDSSVSTATITVAESCSMVATTDTAHTATIPNGIYSGSSDYYPDGIGQTTLKVYCNDTSGFSIYAIGYTGEQYSGEDHTKLIGTDNTNKIATGTADSGQTSNWAMKLATNAQATYPITLENGYGAFSAIPDTYTKVATRAGSTDVGDIATGASLTTTYAAYISPTQLADTYTGKVKYTMVHPASETPLQPQPSTAGYINYYANASDAVGTMGRQSASDGNEVKLFASNFSRDGYGFAGWSDTFDYATNANANFYGPNESITVPAGTTANGLALYAVWIKSAGDMQDTAKTATICNGLTAATVGGTRTLDSVSALTDNRDGQTYAIAKLADNKCWMIENLRLADTHQEGANTIPTTLTTTNTNNPLNDNDATNPTVTLKLNYNDTTTATHLSPTSNVAYNADTAPEGWCTAGSAACDDQSRLRTDNTASRATYTTTTNMTSTDVNFYSYGNYYNWYSATAGRGTYSTGANVNAVGDLCPTGWRVPRGGDKANESNNEFWPLVVTYLNNGVNPANYSSSSTPYYSGTAEAGPVDNAIRTWPNNFLHSGHVNGASFSNRGSDGYYWSSTASSTNNAYHLYFSSSSVTPGTRNNSIKYYGRIVRCLVSPGA